MPCPYLKECFKQSIDKGNPYFEKERCTHEERWSRCPLFLEKAEVRELEKTHDETLENGEEMASG